MARDKVYQDRSGVIAGVNQSQQLTDENQNRRRLFIRNISADTLWIEFGKAAVQDTPSIPINPTEVFDMKRGDGFVDPSAIYIVGPNIGAKYVAREA